MPPQKARLLERILMVLIVYLLVFSAWHMYGYLVRAYESHWVSTSRLCKNTP